MNLIDKQSIIDAKKYIISIDYQIGSVYALFLVIDNDNHTYVITIYHYYSDRDGYKTDEDIYNDLLEMVKNYRHHNITIEIAPDAASLIECIRRHDEFELTIQL